MFKKILLGVFVLIIAILVGGYTYYRFVIYEPPAISQKDRNAITLMPLPAKLQLKGGYVNLSKGVHVNFIKFKNKAIAESVDRFISRIEQQNNVSMLNGEGIDLNICCIADSPGSIQQVNEDESYSLEIERNKITLEANSPFGIFHGLETIYQLIEEDEDGEYLISFASITDKPRFPWRGLMLDVCRHWIPKDVVLRTIDAMAAVKMNVFHWHLSEDQGFRVESKVFPKLHELGSNGKYYTQEEIKEVIAYAADRGIRVVPEFDLPGHSKSWQMAYPELSSVDFSLKFGRTNNQLFEPPIDPTKEVVYAFLDQFIEEMAALFPDPYFHIGGDEVNPKYWNESESIQQFMQEEGMKDHHDLQAYFNTRMNKLIKKHGKVMLGWDEILHPDLGNDIVVQSWRSHKSLFEAVQNGGTAILSAGLYMDLILSAEKHYSVDPLVLEGAVDIEPDTANWKMYDLKMDFAGNEMESELVIFDKDPTNIFGFFAFMESRMAFKNGVLEGDELSFSFLGPAGEMSYKATTTGDSLSGKMSFGILGFDSWGSRSGGSDMAGTEMPKIEVMKPLTPEEQSRIIGGEACQWAEFVDGENVESRLWPRSAAIAEKLWSPLELTTDVEDMYRRLEVVSNQLTAQGSMHNKQYEMKLHELIAPVGFEPLKTLVDVLEEVKYHGRMGSLLEQKNLYLPDFPLDRIVDAARPESLEARAFNKLAEKLSMDSSNDKVKSEVLNHLRIWEQNHDNLAPFFNESDKLMEIEYISFELAAVSKEAVRRLAGEEPNFSDEEIMKKLSFLEVGEHGVIVAVVPGLRSLLIN